MTSTFAPAGSGDGPARVCILGDPGVGKTRLAATFPHPLFLDLENGAGTARPEGVNRLLIATDRHALEEVRRVIQALNGAEPENGTVEFPVGDATLEVGTLVIDSVDAIQQPVKMFQVLRGRTKMERSDWDTLLNKMMPLVLDWNSLPVHLVVIAHTKTQPGEDSRAGEKGFGVQGSLRTQMPRWFSVILHLVSGPDGQRYAVSQPMISKGYRYLAKDRHTVLQAIARNGIIDLPCDEGGYPDDRIARTICGLTEDVQET